MAVGTRWSLVEPSGGFRGLRDDAASRHARILFLTPVDISAGSPLVSGATTIWGRAGMAGVKRARGFQSSGWLLVGLPPTTPGAPRGPRTSVPAADVWLEHKAPVSRHTTSSGSFVAGILAAYVQARAGSPC
ncbi:hypothetical protein IMZ48_44370 [Candidatus Bathyarchaeota archaeon]|nr:hypothetical protein [Candidatus Bathyarchaeota archaeon]